MTTMNAAQRETCHRLWSRHFDDHARDWATPDTYVAFRRRFHHVHEGSGPGYFFGQMPGGNLWIGIERDGYAHS